MGGGERKVRGVGWEEERGGVGDEGWEEERGE